MLAGGGALLTPQAYLDDGLLDVMLVPDLSARITLLDKDDKVITHLGEDPEWRAAVLKDGMKLRREELAVCEGIIREKAKALLNTPPGPLPEAGSKFAFGQEA